MHNPQSAAPNPAFTVIGNYTTIRGRTSHASTCLDCDGLQLLKRGQVPAACMRRLVTEQVPLLLPLLALHHQARRQVDGITKYLKGGREGWAGGGRQVYGIDEYLEKLWGTKTPKPCIPQVLKATLTVYSRRTLCAPTQVHSKLPVVMPAQTRCPPALNLACSSSADCTPRPGLSSWVWPGSPNTQTPTNPFSSHRN